MFLGYPLSGVLFIKMFQYMEYQYLKSNINIIKDPIWIFNHLVQLLYLIEYKGKNIFMKR